ncbi:MAG TPA: serine/threonine-protein kinase [Myxococcota bacterium]|nr:serine/threonine-protein kinase [Myxococcota bacterium]HRY95963.1 serine/threonine-protein kinase [Myxococcota bacterium]HSA23481.1 serine/threonine-protein kinase [Myxococcota bacterium]
MRQPIPFGRYLLLERINVGGMAEIYLARSRGLQGFRRLLAIKKILPTMAEDEEFIAMFVDEARIAAELSHAGIVQIFELGRFSEDYYIAMEFVHGKDLRFIQERQARAGKPLDVNLTALVAVKILEALDYAHNKRDPTGKPLGIIHRDISPQNVIVSFDGEVKICDFGIAKAANRGQKTQAGVLKGKFGYMSPEQVRGLPLDGRSDLFTVGTLMYEMVTLERLFVGESDFSTLEKVRNADVVPPSSYNRDVPEQLEDIILRALSKEVEDRFQNAMEMSEALQAYLLNTRLIGSRELSAYLRETFRTEHLAELKRLEEYNDMPEPDEEALASGGGAGQYDEPGLAAPVDSEGKTLIFAARDEDGQLHSSPPQPGPAAGHPPPLDAKTVIFSDGQATPSKPPPLDAKTVIFSEPSPDDEVPTHMLEPPPLDDSTAPAPRPGGRGRSLSERLFPWVAMLAALLLGYSLFSTYRLRSQAEALQAVGTTPPALELNTLPPTGVQVLLDGREVASATPVRFEDLEAGEHRLRVTRAGFEPFERRLTLEPNQRLVLEVFLRPGGGPAEATDGGAAGADAGALVAVEAGPPEGPDAGAPSAADAGALAVADAGPAPPVAPSLSVSSEPPGAKVLLNGKLVGQTPLELPGLKVGQVRLALELKGFKVHSEALRLAAGERKQVAVSLQRKAAPPVKPDRPPPPPPPPPRKVEYGYLMANTRPWSKVFVDGADTGRETPIPPDKKLKLSAGKHKVTFETPGGQRYDFEVDIVANETKKLIKKLE